MMSTKMAAPALLKVKVFWNKDLKLKTDIFCLWRHQQNFSHGSNYIMDVTKFGNSSICIREVIITSSLSRFDQKNLVRGGLDSCSIICQYTSLSKGLKLKVRKFWRLIPTFVDVTGEKLVGEGGTFPKSWMHCLILFLNIFEIKVSHFYWAKSWEI